MKRRDFLRTSTLGAAAAAAATSFPTPSLAQGRTTMVMVSAWPQDLPGLGSGSQRLAQRLNDLSEGRIVVEYYGAGERVGAFDSFDEVASGNAQAYHAAEYYWKGKHAGFPYFTTVPFGLTYPEMNAWIRFMGGQELWDKLTDEFGIKSVMAGSTGCQMGGWFRKEINSVDDLTGLKIRIPGIGGDVMTKVGASPVSLPGGQIYENLVTGAIDATEWATPWLDSFMKFYEAAKYYYSPTFHEPGSMLSVGLNKSWWSSLPRSDQVLIEAACAAENDITTAEFNARNGEALTELVENQGVQLRRFNDDVYDAFYEAAQEVFEEARAHSALVKEIDDSFRTARQDLAAWTTVGDHGFVTHRNRLVGT